MSQAHWMVQELPEWSLRAVLARARAGRGTGDV